MIAEDLTTFFNPDEFADIATLAGVDVTGFFDKAYVVDASGFGSSATRPAFTMAASALPASFAGLVLVHDQVSYVVTNIDPQGSDRDISVLLLELA